jgi:AraC-like DNA-binding protein
MSQNSIVGSSPVEDVVLVDKLHFDMGHRFTAMSLPGHLVHLVLSGSVTQSCNGREYTLREGDIIWYFENEWVEGAVVEAPLVFYTVNFLSSTLIPPPETKRVFKGKFKQARSIFKALYDQWNADIEDPFFRRLCIHEKMHHLMVFLYREGGFTYRSGSQSLLWWKIENQFREDITQMVSLDDLASRSKVSSSTILRACREAVGLSPIRRLKQIRLGMACGLLEHSERSITEIAQRVGYSRIHEFSRDFKKEFQVSPREWRRERLSEKPK